MYHHVVSRRRFLSSEVNEMEPSEIWLADFSEFVHLGLGQSQNKETQQNCVCFSDLSITTLWKSSG